MAVEKYDRWYIVGHSLGSVIAFKGLMSPGNALARYMSINRWDSRDLQEFITASDSNIGYADEPRCPHWLDRSAALDRGLLFSRLRGFITYGSPLEIFAHLWPAIVQVNKEKVFPADFEWLNFYNSTDIVARRPPRSFADAEAISPKNFCCASSRRVWQAHTRYFHMPGDADSSTLPALVEWMVGSPSSVEALPASPMSPGAAACRRCPSARSDGAGVWQERSFSAFWSSAFCFGRWPWPISGGSSTALPGFSIRPGPHRTEPKGFPNWAICCKST